MITGLFETHLNVADLERSMRFYGDVLELEFAHIEQARRVAFYWIGGRGNAMLGLWETPEEDIQRQHFAFTVDRNMMPDAVAYLLARDLTPRNFFNDDARQPMVFGWMPAVAIYFADPDGHSLELIAMLPDDPRPELDVVSWDEWAQLVQQT